jgi:hypothetical protein
MRHIKAIVLSGLALLFVFSAAAQGMKMEKPMMAECKAMMERHHKMQAEMKQMDERLERLVTEMNSASGSARVDRMAAVINEMVSQRRAMHERMSSMMPKMMQHMSSHMGHAMMRMHGEMAHCPMMKQEVETEEEDHEQHH